MARARTVFLCSSCGAPSPSWVGRCPACRDWNSLVEQPAPARAGAEGEGVQVAVRAITDVAPGTAACRTTGIAELDRVLGGGLVPGSVTLLGGEPGIGKSTLALQLAAAVAAPDRPVLYVSAEESQAQVRRRAERLDALRDQLLLTTDAELPSILAAVEQTSPALVVVDSVQTVRDPSSSAGPGTVTQVRDCSAALVRHAKAREVATLLVGHVTKDGGLAGPRVLEHLVDTVLTFEGDRHHALRLLRATKHRFGGTDELAVFEMTGTGLAAVADPSALFLDDRRGDVPGSVVVPVLDGYRPVLVEVQALTTAAVPGQARRQAHGLDVSRLAMVLAVLTERVGFDLAGRDVHALAVGGLRLTEPAVDLGMALAVASSLADRALPAGLVVVGEIGLGGELRQVQHTARRLAEAARLGFDAAIVPRASPDGPTGLRLLRAGTVGEALALASLPLP